MLRLLLAILMVAIAGCATKPTLDESQFPPELVDGFVRGDQRFIDAERATIAAVNLEIDRLAFTDPSALVVAEAAIQICRPKYEAWWDLGNSIAREMGLKPPYSRTYRERFLASLPKQIVPSVLIARSRSNPQTN